MIKDYGYAYRKRIEREQDKYLKIWVVIMIVASAFVINARADVIIDRLLGIY